MNNNNIPQVIEIRDCQTGTIPMLPASPSSAVSTNVCDAPSSSRAVPRGVFSVMTAMLQDGEQDGRNSFSSPTYTGMLTAVREPVESSAITTDKRVCI
jgi:hypothetical protein